MTTAKKQTIAGTLEWVSEKARGLIGGPGREIWIYSVHPDGWLIAEEYNGSGSRHWRYSWEIEDDELILGDPEEVEIETTVEVVAKAELTGPIVMKDEARQIAWAAVLVPGEGDKDGDELTTTEIERVAHGWMASYRNLDIEHTLNNVEAVPVESYITPVDLTVELSGEETTLPAGSWIMASKVTDDDVWKRIMLSETDPDNEDAIAGYSIMGVPVANVPILEKALAAMKGADTAQRGLEDLLAVTKRTTIEDLGDDWVVTHVSYVGKPAVPKAMWFALKAATEKAPDSPLFADLADLLGGVGKDGRKFSRTTSDRLEAGEKALVKALEAVRSLLSEASAEQKARTSKKASEEIDMDAEQVQKMVDEAVESALGSVVETIEKAVADATKGELTAEEIAAEEAKAEEATAAAETAAAEAAAAEVAAAEAAKGSVSREDHEAAVAKAAEEAAAVAVAAVTKSKGLDDGSEGKGNVTALLPNRDALGRPIKKEA